MSALAVAYPPDVKDSRHTEARAYPECAQWLASVSRRLRPRSVEDYTRDVAAFLRMWPDVDYTAIRAPHVDVYLAAYSEGTHHRKLAALGSWFKWGYRNDLIDRNPLDKVEPLRRKKQRYIETYSPAEVELLTSLLDDRRGTLCLLLFDTGIRNQEARMLRRRHVLLDRKQLIILGSDSGGGAKGDKDRVIPLTSRLHDALEAWFLLDPLDPTDHLWGTKPGGGSIIRRADAISSTVMHTWWQDTTRTAGVRYLKLHTTRHTFATRLIQQGVGMEAVARLLGHESVRTTVDTYVHLVVEDLRNAIGMLEIA